MNLKNIPFLKNEDLLFGRTCSYQEAKLKNFTLSCIKQVDFYCSCIKQVDFYCYRKQACSYDYIH